MAQNMQSAVEVWFASIGTAPDYETMHYWAGTGQSTFDINFAGGYISREHVKAFIREDDTGVTSTVSLTFQTASRVVTSQPVPVGWTICIYRDTPKNAPLALFVDGAILNAVNLDRNAKQSVFAVAELLDRFDATNAMADEAILRSSQALIVAQAAEATSAQASADAAEAKQDANIAQGAATSAADSASTAATLAGTANANANHAVTVAEGIDAKATQALATSNDANTTANGIDAKATQAQTDAAQALATINAVAGNALLDDGSKRFKSLASKDIAPAPLTDGFTIFQWGADMVHRWGNITSSIFTYAYNKFQFMVPVRWVDPANPNTIHHDISNLGNINNVAYMSVTNRHPGGSPRYELHRVGEHASILHLTPTGATTLSSSDGYGNILATQMQVISDGRIVPGYGVSSGFNYYGAAPFQCGERSNFTPGEHTRLISLSYNTGGTGGATYAVDNYLGVYRNGTSAENNTFVLGMTDGNAWTKTWYFAANGKLSSPAQNSSRWFFESNGHLWGTGYGNQYIHEWASQNFAPLSDARVKDIVGPATKRALDYVEQMEFVEYDFKEEFKDFGEHHIDVGVTVQQLMEVNPAFGKLIATYGADGAVVDEVLSIHLTNLISVLLKSVAELNAEVKLLKNAST